VKPIFGMLLVALAAGPALADSTVYVIAKTQSEASGLDAKIAAERHKAARSRADYAPLAKEFNAIKVRHDAIRKKYAAEAAAYNRSCAGRPVDTPGCPSWRARVAAQQRQLTPLLKDMERRAATLQRRGQQLLKDATAADTRAQKLANYKSQLLASARNLKTALAKQCAGITASSSVAEMNQKCGHLPFTGAKTALPKCTTNQCKQFKLAAPAPTPVPVANTKKCEGAFCTKDNPKNAGGATIPSGQAKTKYDSASAQLDAAAKAKQAAGCVFDGQAGCTPGTSLKFPTSGAGRGSASLSPAVKEAMSKSPAGQKLLGEETALRGQYAGAEAKLAAIKAKRDAATGPARGQLAIDYVNADKIKTDIGQQLYVKEIAIETEAKKLVAGK
jgi:hypothetical protein